MRTRALGFPDPPGSYPSLFDQDEGYHLRPAREIQNRAAVLNIVVARTFGMPASLGKHWVADNGLVGALSPIEAELMDDADASKPRFQAQIEALWALTWVLGLTPSLDPTAYCEASLSESLPDLRTGAGVEAWRGRLGPIRNADDVMTELDLLYCLTWGLAEANLHGTEPPGTVEQYIHWERRRALEWVLVERGYGATEWDHIDVST